MGADMEQHISLREANQHFSKYVKAVEAGEEIIITRRGEPVVRLTSVPKVRSLSAAQQAAWERTRQRMGEGYSLGGNSVDRDALHER